MILYNMRYNGPYEYDKTVLNILQFHNEVNFINKYELSNIDNENLFKLKKQINTIFNTISSNNNSNNVLKLLQKEGW